MCPSRVLWFSGRSQCVPGLTPRNYGGATAVCPPQTQLNIWGPAWSRAGGWVAQQAAGAANGWVPLHRWLPVLRSRHLSAATNLFVLRSRIAPCMSYGMELWRPSKRGANMTAVLVRAAKLISGIYRDASHRTLFDFGAIAVASACSLCRERVFPSCPDFGSAPRAQANREHRWRRIEHLLFECPGILGAGTLVVKLLRDDLFRACFGSDHASAVLLAAFPSDRTPVVAATACLVPFLLDPAAALGRPPPWRMKLQCLALVSAFLLGVSSAACMRLPPSQSVLASLRLPAWSSVRSWLLCLQSGSLSAPVLLPAPTPVRICPPLCAGALWPMPAWV